MQTFSKVGALLLLVFAISSCSQDSTSTSYVSRPSVTSDWDSVGVSFPGNPWDSVGYFHNLSMDYVAAHMDPVTWTNDSVRECIIQFMHARWGSDMDSMRAFLVFGDSVLRNPSTQSIAAKDSFATLLNTPDFVASTHRVDSLLHDTLLTKQQFLFSIQAEEAYVNAQPSFSTVQRDFLEEVYAITRYSYAYWNSTAKLAYAPNVYGIRPRTKLGKGTSGRDVVVSDAIGAIGGAVGGFLNGALKGAVLGSLGGPVGTAGGAAGGAIVGSGKGAVAGAAVASASTATHGSTGSTFDGLVDGFYGSLFSWF